MQSSATSVCGELLLYETFTLPKASYTSQYLAHGTLELRRLCHVGHKKKKFAEEVLILLVALDDHHRHLRFFFFNQKGKKRGEERKKIEENISGASLLDLGLRV